MKETRRKKNRGREKRNNNKRKWKTVFQANPKAIDTLIALVNAKKLNELTPESKKQIFQSSYNENTRGKRRRKFNGKRNVTNPAKGAKGFRYREMLKIKKIGKEINEDIQKEMRENLQKNVQSKQPNNEVIKNISGVNEYETIEKQDAVLLEDDKRNTNTRIGIASRETDYKEDDTFTDTEMESDYEKVGSLEESLHPLYDKSSVLFNFLDKGNQDRKAFFMECFREKKEEIMSPSNMLIQVLASFRKLDQSEGYLFREDSSDEISILSNDEKQNNDSSFFVPQGFEYQAASERKNSKFITSLLRRSIAVYGSSFMDKSSTGTG